MVFPLNLAIDGELMKLAIVVLFVLLTYGIVGHIEFKKEDEGLTAFLNCIETPGLIGCGDPDYK